MRGFSEEEEDTLGRSKEEAVIYLFFQSNRLAELYQLLLYLLTAAL